jgi:SecD/SecF fusion protein
MTQDTRLRFIVILILTAIGALVVAPMSSKPFFKDYTIKPGIDLAGGAELRYRLVYDSSAKGNEKKFTDDAAEIVRKRLDAKQLKEPKINTEGEDRIVVQIPGVDRAGLESYKKLVGVGGKLELFAVAPKAVQEQYNASKQVPQGYRAIENTEPRQSGEYAIYSPVMLLRTPEVITGRNIIRSEPHQELVPGGARWVTSFELDADGAKRFDEAAKILYNERPQGLIAIVLDGKLRSAPVVQSDSFGGRGQISGAKDESDAKDLSIILRSGSLPGEMRLDQETFVGPTLGQDAIQRGVVASSITLALVIVFMLVYYRKAGAVAVASLLLNLVYLLAIMSFAGATMTLPGIAGIVLTVGMAVDANILIMERIREEQQKGKSALQCYEAGHERAFSAILDSNITTLIAAAVLYYFGSGPVKGFAVTLSIGILTTLFSVLFCAKTFLKMLVGSGLKEFTMLKLMSSPNLDYLKSARLFVGVSLLLVVAGTGLFFARGKANFGIDFLGGSFVSFRLAEPMKIEDVRKRLADVKLPDGNPKYADAEIQTIADPEATRADFSLGGMAKNFQMRTSVSDGSVKADLQERFKDVISHEPFVRMKPEEADKNPLRINQGPAGPGWFLFLRADRFDLAALRNRLADSPALQAVLAKDDKGKASFYLEEAAEGVGKGLRRVGLHLAKSDADRDGKAEQVQSVLKELLKDDLSLDPFMAEGALGAAVAAELKDKTIQAMTVSWILMILYIAVRFDSWKFGAAAVVALIHDSLISIAFISAAGAVIPKSWGLSFDMGLTTMAAILTIIGYAINDKIVVFDRIRENLGLMKKATFAEVLNASVNQTMSRTILTGVMVWVASIILYGLTMHTGGGIAEFSFPLIVGIVAGTYSTIYIAIPIVYWWYRGQRPQTAA